MIIFKTVLTVLQVLTIISIIFSSKNKNDKSIAIGLSLYMALVGVAMWL